MLDSYIEKNLSPHWRERRGLNPTKRIGAPEKSADVHRSVFMSKPQKGLPVQPGSSKWLLEGLAWLRTAINVWLSWHNRAL
jgi:hypothetical protein